MSDDSFFREVDSELRSDRMQQFWSRFGRIIIAVAVLIVLGIAGARAWDWYQTNRAQTQGDAYMKAVDLAEAGQTAEAQAAFAAIAEDAPATYRALADMRRAAELAIAGEQAEAVALYDAGRVRERGGRRIARHRVHSRRDGAGRYRDPCGRGKPRATPHRPRCRLARVGSGGVGTGFLQSR